MFSISLLLIKSYTSVRAKLVSAGFVIIMLSLCTFMEFGEREQNGVDLFGIIGCNDNQHQHNLDLNYAGRLGFLRADSNFL